MSKNSLFSTLTLNFTIFLYDFLCIQIYLHCAWKHSISLVTRSHEHWNYNILEMLVIIQNKWYRETGKAIFKHILFSKVIFYEKVFFSTAAKKGISWKLYCWLAYFRRFMQYIPRKVHPEFCFYFILINVKFFQY